MTEVLLATLLMVALILALSVIVIAARRVLLPAVPVEVTVNTSLHLRAMTGEKLLTALKVGGLPIPAACGGAGTCGLCKVTVEHGGGEPLPTEVARLGARETARGARLACQLVLRGPVAIRVPEAILAVEPLRTTVVSNRSLAPLIKELVLALPPDAAFDFEAGAFVQVEAPPYALDFRDIEIDPALEPAWTRMGLRRLSVRSTEPVSRAYSIANRPEDAGRIVMDIRLAVPPPSAPDAPPGIVSSWLFALRPGDTVMASGPFGDFRAEASGREMVFIGGGVGMAPLRAIIHDQLTRKGNTRPIRFFYGARSRADLFYEEEMEALARAHPTFTWVPALSDPDPADGWTGATGFVHRVAHDSYLAGHPAPEDCDYYLCGPPLMIRAVTGMLDDLGVEPASIHFDDFGS